MNMKKLLILNIPYFVIGAVATNLGEAWRLAVGTNLSEKLQGMVIGGTFGMAFSNPLPSFYPIDLLVGVAVGAALRLAVYLKGKNAKKYRHNIEYGSARWGKQEDIEPFVDKYDAVFLYQLLNAPLIRKKIIKSSQGNTQIYVNWSAVKELPYLIPALLEQKKIGTYFQNLDNLITLQQRELEKLKNIKKGCLEKMFV